MARHTNTVIISFSGVRQTRVVTAEGDVVVNQIVAEGADAIPTGTVIPAGHSVEIVTRGLVLEFVVQPGGAVTIEEGAAV